jgi:hypothetical protein
MKTSFWILLGISACSGLVVPAKIAPEGPTCEPVPEGVIVGSAAGYLADCQTGESHMCCAYGFLPDHQYVCFHVLCQPVSCNTGWEDIKTVCPPPEQELETTWPKESNPEFRLNNVPLKG